MHSLARDHCVEPVKQTGTSIYLCVQRRDHKAKNDHDNRQTSQKSFIPLIVFMQKYQGHYSIEALDTHSPVGVISTLSAERLLIYSPYVGGLTVRGVRLSLPSTLHTGIATAWSRTCFTCTSQYSRVTLRIHKSFISCHIYCQ